MRTVNVSKYPLFKRLKFLFTNRLYTVAVYDQQGNPVSIEVGPDKPSDVVSLTYDQISQLTAQAQQQGAQQYAEHLAAAQPMQPAPEPPQEPQTAPVDLRGPVPVNRPERRRQEREEGRK